MAANDLVTLAEVKSWLGITGSDDDTKLNRLIVVASQGVRDFLGYDPISHTIAGEIRNGNGGRAIITRERPITAVTAVSVDSVSIPAASSLIGGGFRFNSQMIILNGYEFTRALANVELTYVAGYASGAAELVAIGQGCLDWVKALNDGQEVDLNLASESIPGVWSGSMQPGAAGKIPESAERILSSYRRITP